MTHHAFLQYGVALSIEAVASPGPICPAVANCILGSGGGVGVRVGWRPSDFLYIGGAYEMSKQEPNQLYLLGILQQVRGEMRRYFPTGRETMPFAVVGLGMHGYGNEWGVDTWGPSATVGGGIEIELGRPLALELTLAYRPMYFQAWVDSSTLSHDAGVAHFVGLEIALEAKDSPLTHRSEAKKVSRDRRRLDSQARDGVPSASVICTTCGRENPAHLSFCQECGQRLAPRIVPPTPPIGLPRPAEGIVASSAVEPAPPIQVTAAGISPKRPAAPDVRFRKERPATEPDAPRFRPGARSSPAHRHARSSPVHCSAARQIPRGQRFCVTCGHLLTPPDDAGRAADALRAPPAPRPPPPAPPTSQMHAALPPIAPLRVVALGEPPPVPIQRFCPRCRGASDGTAQFCRFCGGSLADVPALAVHASPDPIASPAPPPVAPAHLEPLAPAAANPASPTARPGRLAQPSAPTTRARLVPHCSRRR